MSVYLSLRCIFHNCWYRLVDNSPVYIYKCIRIYLFIICCYFVKYLSLHIIFYCAICVTNILYFVVGTVDRLAAMAEPSLAPLPRGKFVDTKVDSSANSKNRTKNVSKKRQVNSFFDEWLQGRKKIRSHHPFSIDEKEATDQVSRWKGD